MHEALQEVLKQARTKMFGTAGPNVTSGVLRAGLPTIIRPPCNFGSQLILNLTSQGPERR